MTLLRLICAVAFAVAGMADAQELKQTAARIAQTVSTNPVSQTRLDNTAHDRTNFLTTNGNYEQTRFYPNGQINRGNVMHLHPA
jgi:alcohol dehydrogenase (cytochrome c)